MSKFVPWNSQPIEEWSKKYAAGKFIDLDGYSTHYIEKGEGEPVILLHGFFYNTYLWNKNIDALAAKFKVYALDFWGFGYSSRQPMDYGYPLYASQVLRFMDAMKIQKASLIGQSFGGGTCILFSVQHRDRVKKLVLVDPAGMPSTQPIMIRFSILPRVGEFVYGINNNSSRKMALSSAFFYDKSLITEEYFENVTRPQKIKGTTEGFLSVMRKQFFFTLSNEIHELGKMDVPTLIVWGRNDKALPLKNGQEMHSILKGSRLEIIDRAGHVPNEEQWQQFNQLAVDFLSSVSR